jgi:hypothetical protein
VSYTVGIWQGESPSTFEEAEAYFSELQERNERSAAAAPLLAFVESMLRHFPEPMLDVDNFDENAWVWSDAPLLGNIEGVISVLGIMFRHVDRVMPLLLSEAKYSRLNVIDWQTGELHKADAVVVN